MICKNEKSNIADLLEDVCPVLENVVIVDTGSTDGTLEIIKEKQAKYSNLRLEHFVWIEDFSAARNYAFSFATDEFVMFLDADDRVDSKALKTFKDGHLNDPNTDCWLLDYVYSRFPDGKPQTILGRERFVRRSLKPTWIGAIHETINICGMRQKHYYDLQVIHNHKGKQIDYSRNVRILAKEYEKNPNDPRTAYYYGKELFDRVDPKGIEVLDRYLTLPGQYWDDSVNARMRLGLHCISIKQHRKALEHAFEIYNLDHSRQRAESFFLYGVVEQEVGNHKIAIDWFKKCLTCTPEPPRVINREFYTWHPLKKMVNSYAIDNRWAEAYGCIKQINEILPNDHGIKVWVDGLKSQQLKSKSLKVIEINTKVRADSTQLTTGTAESYTIDPEFIPFADAYLDGAVVDVVNNVSEDLLRALKPKAFLWSLCQLPSNKKLGFLGQTEYNGFNIFNYIRVDETKPTIGYMYSDDKQFGPYRIRILSLIKSAVKSGYPVTTDRCDIYVSPRLFSKNPHGVTVIDVCEQLPKDQYDRSGLGFADVVCACSPLLEKHINSLYPDKPTFVVDDHFEYTDREWL